MIQFLLNLFKPTPTIPWDKPVKLYYTDPNIKGLKGNVLTVVTHDQNIKEYYHTINESPPPYRWKLLPSFITIRDEKTIDQLNKYYRAVMRDGRRQWGGWVLSLR